VGKKLVFTSPGAGRRIVKKVKKFTDFPRAQIHGTFWSRGENTKKEKFTMASHFESSELQLTPQLTPLFAYLLYVGGALDDRKGKLKITFPRSCRRKFQIIGWGIVGAHDEDAKSVQPYVLFQNMTAAAIPLDALLVSGVFNEYSSWDVSQSDADLLEFETSMYALVQISSKKPSRKLWKQVADTQSSRLAMEHIRMISSDEYEFEDDDFNEEKPQTPKKKKKK
jgi:hypothetical protein